MSGTGQHVMVVVRARLRGDPAEARKLHDEVTGATHEAALAAGDLTHHIYLDPADPGAFLGIDTWQSAEQAAAFSSNPQIADFFGRLFDGPPDVQVWVPSGWNEW